MYLGSTTQSFLAGEKQNPSMVHFSFLPVLFKVLGNSNG